MPCEHLRELYQFCQTHDLKITSADVIRIACRECDQVEVCPSMLTDEYDSRQKATADSPSSSGNKTDS